MLSVDHMWTQCILINVSKGMLRRPYSLNREKLTMDHSISRSEGERRQSYRVYFLVDCGWSFEVVTISSSLMKEGSGVGTSGRESRTFLPFLAFCVISLSHQIGKFDYYMEGRHFKKFIKLRMCL